VFGTRRRRQPEKLPGGYTEGQCPPGTLYISDPLPPRCHSQDQVARGVCFFTGQLLISGGGPQQSPMLGFKMTRDAIWTLNTDGTLYQEVPWSDIRRLVIREDASWAFRGSFVRHEFMVLKVEPSWDTVQAMLDLAVERGIEFEVVKEPPDNEAEQTSKPGGHLPRRGDRPS
jgi:hypothetical protein